MRTHSLLLVIICFYHFINNIHNSIPVPETHLLAVEKQLFDAINDSV